MWTDLRKEIEKIRKDFSLRDNQFRPLGLNEWQEIENKIYQTFCKLTHHKSRPVWLWEHFKLDTFSLSNLKNRPEIYLDRLIDENETVWYVVNETINEENKFWFFEGKIKCIQTIIDKTWFNELYLISKKYEWLICINHHDCLIATGAVMPDKLRELKFDQ